MSYIKIKIKMSIVKIEEVNECYNTYPFIHSFIHLMLIIVMCMSDGFYIVHESSSILGKFLKILEGILWKKMLKVVALLTSRI